MAQFVATFDSVTKALSVTMDGVPVADLEALYFHKKWEEPGEDEEEEPEFHMEAVTCKQDKANKMAQRTRLMASAQGLEPAEAALKRDVSAFLAKRLGGQR